MIIHEIKMNRKYRISVEITIIVLIMKAVWLKLRKKEITFKNNKKLKLLKNKVIEKLAAETIFKINKTSIKM